MVRHFQIICVNTSCLRQILERWFCIAIFWQYLIRYIVTGFTFILRTVENNFYSSYTYFLKLVFTWLSCLNYLQGIPYDKPIGFYPRNSRIHKNLRNGTKISLESYDETFISTSKIFENALKVLYWCYIYDKGMYKVYLTFFNAPRKLIKIWYPFLQILFQIADLCTFFLEVLGCPFRDTYLRIVSKYIFKKRFPLPFST